MISGILTIIMFQSVEVILIIILRKVLAGPKLIQATLSPLGK